MLKELSKEERKYYLDDLISLWYENVINTHTFLTKEQIDNIKLYVDQAILSVNNFIVSIKDNKILGFIGINDNVIEMLFVNINKRGQGIGKQLILEAINKYQVNEVSCNEDNVDSIKFYEYMGFRITDRKPIDDHGDPYPILTLRLD